MTSIKRNYTAKFKRDVALALIREDATISELSARYGGTARRQEMIIPAHNEISVREQCNLLSLNRSMLYYTPKGENLLNLKLMRLIDEQFLKTPFYGSRQMARFLKREGYCVSRNRVRRLMKKMGITAVYSNLR